MTTLGIDHAVLAVADLEAARARLTQLGFLTHPGADRPGRGVRTLLVRLGLSALEVRAITDAEHARASDMDGPGLVNYVNRHGGGLAGYALRTADLDGMARQLMSTSLRAFTHLRFEGPFALSRPAGDGQTVAWRMLMPGGVAWRRPWPLVVQWDTPDGERRALEPPDQQPNTATGISGIALAVANLESARAIYREQLGLDAAQLDEVPSLAAHRATYQLGGCAIQLLSPQGDDSPLEAALARGGEGPFELTLAVSDFDACRSVLERAGVAYHTAPDHPGALALDPDEALGARLVFTAAAPFAVADGGASGTASSGEQANNGRDVARETPAEPTEAASARRT